MSDPIYVSKEDVQLVMNFESMYGYFLECISLYGEMAVIESELQAIQDEFMSASAAIDGMYYGQGSDSLAEYLVCYRNHICQIALYLKTCLNFMEICNNTIFQEDQKLQKLVTLLADISVIGGENGG